MLTLVSLRGASINHKGSKMIIAQKQSFINGVFGTKSEIAPE